MRQILCRARLQWFASSTLRLKPPSLLGRLVGPSRVEALCTLTTSNGLMHWTDSTTKPFQEQIVDALCLGERSKASSLLSELVRTVKTLKANDFLLVLQYCARLPDPLFALETWKVMEEKEIYAGGKCYFYTVRALCKGGYLKEAFNLMGLLRENPAMYPLLPLYNSFFSACVQNESVNYANNCLELMEHQTVGNNEITYALLLKLAVLHQNLPAVHEIWKESIKYYSLNIISLRKFIWSFTRLRDLESAYVTLQYMVRMAFRGNSVIFKTAEGKLSDSRLDIPIPLNGHLSLKNCTKDNGIVPSVPENVDRSVTNPGKLGFEFKFGVESHGASRVITSRPVKHLELPVMKLLRWSFSDVIHACADMQNCTLAERLISQMQNLGLEPSSGTYDGFLRAVVQARGFYDGMQVLEVMQQKKLKPYDSTLAAISVGCSKGLQLDLAESFLDKISKTPSPYPYNAFFEACDVLLRALGMEGMIKELTQYLHDAERPSSSLYALLGTPVYNVVLHSLVQAKETHMAVETFKIMKSRGISSDAVTYSIMTNCCSTMKSARSAYALVSMMIRDGFYPETVTYTSLIKTLLGLDDFNEALKLLNQGKLDKVQPDVLLYNTLLQEACQKGKIDVIELIVEQMHREKIQPDPSTCHYVFSAYVDQGFYSTAMEALLVMSMRMISEDDDIREEERAEFENLIVAEDMEARIIDLFKISMDDIHFALLHLRWCAMLGYTVSWLPNESQWAKRLSENYALLLEK
ncbi:pentatricopeptide repeat-containing protein At1g76280-like isoform X4 [Coffea arabica]|uniref:Pentatricopeptide repeat-containing protein At1g76280-like isoform X4 n=1 Tax=Coffea arabica TaxID=13443 RepID=A0ABM4VK99_COFAR